MENRELVNGKALKVFSRGLILIVFLFIVFTCVFTALLLNFSKGIGSKEIIVIGDDGRVFTINVFDDSKFIVKGSDDKEFIVSKIGVGEFSYTGFDGNKYNVKKDNSKKYVVSKDGDDMSVVDKFDIRERFDNKLFNKGAGYKELDGNVLMLIWGVLGFAILVLLMFLCGFPCVMRKLLLDNPSKTESKDDPINPPCGRALQPSVRCGTFQRLVRRRRKTKDHSR